MFFSNEKDNAIEATYLFSQALHVPISYTSLKNKLENHPDYPSLLAVCNVLNSYQIQNMPIQISPEELENVPTPCLAALDIKGGIFAVINSVQNGIVKWSHSEKEQQQEAISTFSEKWKGVLLLAETTETSGEKNYIINRRREILNYIGKNTLVLGGVLIIVLVLYLLIFSKVFSIFLFSLLVTKALGIFVSILLLWYLIDKSHPFLRNICEVGKSSDCNSVLNSKAASIGGILSWSEIGFFYFLGSFLALIFPSNEFTLQFLKFINLAALPYTFFSIYYQAYIAKKWCILCLSVQILLWIEFLLFFQGFSYKIPSHIDGYNVVTLMFSFVLPVVIWFSIKPILTLTVKNIFLEDVLRKFQNNASVFHQLLSEQHQMLPLPIDIPIIEIGKSDAPNTITIITSPYCVGCFKVHSIANEIVLENANYVKCQFIISAPNGLNDRQGIFAKHIFSLDKLHAEEALTSWFSKKYEIEEWKAVYPIQETDKNVHKILNQYEKWCIDRQNYCL